jgi:DNA-binding beta-propeller fold protein YncE
LARNQIYVANHLNDSILVFHDARTATGGDAPARTITSTSMDGPTALFMDVVNDRLFVTNTDDDSVLIYDSASILNGGVTPAATLTGAATTLNAPTGIYLDTTRNLVYVANGNNQVLVFNNAAIVAGNNDISPLRSIPILSGSAGIFVDVMADRIYVASGNSVLVFDSTSRANGSSVPNRTISGGGSMLSQPRDIFVDSGTDRLFVANLGGNSVLVFNSASTVNGNVAPDHILSLTPMTDPWGIYVDVTPIVIGSTADLDGYALDDGSVNTDPLGADPNTGDMEDGFLGPRLVARQFYSFALTGIPSSTSVLSATLRLYQANVENSPYGLDSWAASSWITWITAPTWKLRTTTPPR